MSNSELWQQYRLLLLKADFVVTYSALSDEIPIEEIPNFELIEDKPKFVVPPTHKIEPKEVAKEIQNNMLLASPLAVFRRRHLPNQGSASTENVSLGAFSVAALGLATVSRSRFAKCSRDIAPTLGVHAKHKQLCLARSPSPTPCHLIFLPGQKFDLTGTRKGRGFGWYDRLLAELPSDWIRVGIATESQLENITLIRNPWDQPIDWLIWKKKNYWEIIETKQKNRLS
jgi:hypothetical protein